MKKLFLAGALFLATGTVQAAPPWTEEELRSGTRKIEITRHVPSGVTSTLGILFYLTQSCDPRTGAEMQIMKDPEHGTAELVLGDEIVNLTKDNDRFHWNGKKRPGTAIKYTSKDGYVGTDDFVVLELVGGFAVERTMHVVVYARKANKNGR
jgi:hypothetical protein